jgi:hypothetical protein
MKQTKSNERGDSLLVYLYNLNKNRGARGLLPAPPVEYQNNLASLLTPGNCSALGSTGMEFSVMSVEDGALLLTIFCQENIAAVCAVGSADSDAARAAWTSAFEIPAAFGELDPENACPNPPSGTWLALHFSSASHRVKARDFEQIQKFLHALPFALSRWEEMEKSTNDQN